jgi:hypothetical protein
LKGFFYFFFAGLSAGLEAGVSGLKLDGSGTAGLD